MNDRLDGLERRLEELAARVSSLDQEVKRLRRGRPEDPMPTETTPPSAPDAHGSPGEDWAISRGIENLLDRYRIVQLAGLVSLVLAGAMVLRLIAISSPVPLPIGAGLGLAYCSALLVISEWRLRKGSHLHGDVFAVLAVLILGMLLLEVTHRPGGFSRRAAFAILAAALAANSLLTIRRMRVAPFVVGILAAPIAGVAIGGSPFLHAHFASVLVIAVLCTQTGMRVNSWDAPRWGPGLMSLLYLLVLGAIAGAVVGKELPQHVHARPAIALAVMSAFFVLHVLFAAGVALFRPRRLDPYEVAIAIATAIVAFAFAGRVLLELPNGRLIWGVAGVLVAVVFYVVAALSYALHGSESGSFQPLSAIALVYSVPSLAVLIGGEPALGAALQVLALGLAVFASRYGKRSIYIQAHVLTVLAFVALAWTTILLNPPSGPTAPLLQEAGWLVVTGLAAVLVFVRLRGFREPGQRFLLHRLGFGAISLVLVLAVGVLEAVAGATVPVHLLGRSLIGAGSGEPAAAVWHTTQTLLLACGAVTTLGVGVRLRLGGATALGAGLMALAGLKLLLVDAFRVPGAYLACSSAAFGVALILSSVLYRKYRGLREEGAGSSGDGETSMPEAGDASSTTTEADR